MIVRSDLSLDPGKIFFFIQEGKGVLLKFDNFFCECMYS